MSIVLLAALGLIGVVIIGLLGSLGGGDGVMGGLMLGVAAIVLVGGAVAFLALRHTGMVVAGPGAAPGPSVAVASSDSSSESRDHLKMTVRYQELNGEQAATVQRLFTQHIQDELAKLPGHMSATTSSGEDSGKHSGSLEVTYYPNENGVEFTEVVPIQSAFLDALTAAELNDHVQLSTVERRTAEVVTDLEPPTPAPTDATLVDEAPVATPPAK